MVTTKESLLYIPCRQLHLGSFLNTLMINVEVTCILIYKEVAVSPIVKISNSWVK